MPDVVTWLQPILELDPTLEVKLLSSLIILALLWLLRFLAVQMIDRRVQEMQARHVWHKALTYLTGLLALFLVGRIWLEGVQSMATFLGLLAAGLAVALQTPLTNLAGWLFILWRRPFRVGDRVAIAGQTGDVIDIGMFQSTLLEVGGWVDGEQHTGRMIHLPNGQILSQPLVNYTKGFPYIWHEIPVLVTFESDWEEAKALFQAILTEHAGPASQEVQEQMRRATYGYPFAEADLAPRVVTKVEESGVALTLRYLCHPRERRASQEAIWEAILRALTQHPTIELAYPTQRVYARWLEQAQPTPPQPSSQEEP